MKLSNQHNQSKFMLYAGSVAAVGLIFIISELYISISNISKRIINETNYLITKDVTVIPVHSHNDEWRYRPLFDLLSIGAQLVELDVWTLDGSSKDKFSSMKKDVLYVGHNKMFLKDDVNLDNLYLNHFYNILSHNNQDNTENPEKQSGIFFDSPEKTLFFYIDVKLSDGNKTLELLDERLQVFKENNWLTYHGEDEKLHWGPLTIVITGNFPLPYIKEKANTKNYYFIDAPLKDIFDAKFPEVYNAGKLAIISSSSLIDLLNVPKSILGRTPSLLKKGLNEAQLKKLADYITKAHELGVMVRIWDTPNWPIKMRNQIWNQLLELGVDFLNVDDLKSAANLF